MTTTKETPFFWKNETSFVLITAGATLSIRDFLTFPVMAGENGGAAFLLLYVFFLLLMGLPLMMSELMLGRMTKKNIVDALSGLASDHTASVLWAVVGLLSLFAGFLILSSYSVVSGWSLAYLFKTGLGVYNGVTAEGINTLFSYFQTNPEAMILWHTLFILAVIAIGAQKAARGLERVLLILVPAAALFLIIGLVYAYFSSGMLQSIEYILFPDFSKLDANMPLLALERAFFTLALGLGIMIIFGSYLDKDISIGYVAGQVIIIDLLFSIMAGLAINALVFSVDLAPVLDDELAFRVLPVIFGKFEYGTLFGSMFYMFLSLAAITTAVALLEAVMTYYQSKRGVSRLKAALQVGLAVWILGLGTIFSYSLWDDSGFTMTLYFGDEGHRLVNEAGFHDIINFLSGHIIQPFVALLLTLFVGWILPRKLSYEALDLPNRKLFEIWNFTIRYITPTLVFIVLLSTIGIIGSSS